MKELNVRITHDMFNQQLLSWTNRDFDSRVVCLGGLQLEVDNVQSFGVVFLKSHYTVFDRGNLLLGFAPHE